MSEYTMSTKGVEARIDCAMRNARQLKDRPQEDAMDPADPKATSAQGRTTNTSGPDPMLDPLYRQLAECRDHHFKKYRKFGDLTELLYTSYSWPVDIRLTLRRLLEATFAHL